MLYLCRGDAVLTDLLEMVPLMKRNSVKNLPVIQGKVLVQPFEWGSDITPLISQESNGFDIVVAADCIYYKEVRYC